MYLLKIPDTDGHSYRAEKVAEITSWLKSHPVSSVSRTSCELQVLDTAIVERIEEAVEKTKVILTNTASSCSIPPPVAVSEVLPVCTRCPSIDTPLSIFSIFVSLASFSQVKKSTKKVRVTVKPHLLFRVSVICLALLQVKAI